MWTYAQGGKLVMKIIDQLEVYWVQAMLYFRFYQYPESEGGSARAGRKGGESAEKSLNVLRRDSAQTFGVPWETRTTSY